MQSVSPMAWVTILLLIPIITTLLCMPLVSNSHTCYMSDVQRPLNVMKLTIPGKMNMETCGNGSTLNPATENCMCQWQKWSPQKNFSQSCFVPILYLFIFASGSSESFDCSNCTRNVCEYSRTNSAQGDGILMLWQHDRSFNLLQPERKLSPSKRSEQAFYILC